MIGQPLTTWRFQLIISNPNPKLLQILPLSVIYPLNSQIPLESHSKSAQNSSKELLNWTEMTHFFSDALIESTKSINFGRFFTSRKFLTFEFLMFFVDFLHFNFFGSSVTLALRFGINDKPGYRHVFFV